MVNGSALTDAELISAEREIARRHIGKFPYLAVVWGLGNFLVWLFLWPLVLTGLLPLWAGFLVATLNLSLTYLPSHEAQHDIIARPGEKLRWLNELVGHLSVAPLAYSYRFLRLTHLEHHKHANNPALDPDYGFHAQSAQSALAQTIVNRRARGAPQKDAYTETLVRIGRGDVILDAVIYEFAYYGMLIALACSGLAIEAALLWWLPRHIGQTYFQFFLGWAPHHPGTETGRYRDTRAFRFALGNIASMGMQYHIIHHLHPRIPLYRTPRAYWEMRDILKARGCDLHGL
jgi:beta-carotene hydroxylase